MKEIEKYLIKGKFRKILESLKVNQKKKKKKRGSFSVTVAKDFGSKETRYI